MRLTSRNTYYWIAAVLAVVSLAAGAICISRMQHDRKLTPDQEIIQRNEVTAKHIGPTCKSAQATTLLPLSKRSPLPCTASNVAGVYTVRQNLTLPGCVDVTVVDSEQHPLGVVHGQKYVDSYCPLVDTHPSISNDR